MSLQVHNNGGDRLYVRAANGLTKDKGVIGVQVMVDTSTWSPRKRNIIVKSLESGIASCGYETATIVDALSQSIGEHVNTVSRWNNHVKSYDVIPEKLDELLSYTSAWVKLKNANMKASSAHYYRDWTERRFEEALEAGKTPEYVPLSNTMTYDEKREFIHPYLLASQSTTSDRLAELIASIRNGETITVTYSN